MFPKEHYQYDHSRYDMKIEVSSGTLFQSYGYGDLYQNQGNRRTDTTAMITMHLEGCLKSKRMGRCKPGMGMILLENGHGKKKVGKGTTPTI